jgi:hypothetical protein
MDQGKCDQADAANQHHHEKRCPLKRRRCRHQRQCSRGWMRHAQHQHQRDRDADRYCGSPPCSGKGERGGNADDRRYEITRQRCSSAGQADWLAGQREERPSHRAARSAAATLSATTARRPATCREWRPSPISHATGIAPSVRVWLSGSGYGGASAGPGQEARLDSKRCQPTATIKIRIFGTEREKS